MDRSSTESHSNDHQEKSPLSDPQRVEEKEKSPILGHLVPTLAPEEDNDDDLPLSIPTPSLAKRSSMGIKSKPVRFHEDTTLFLQSFLAALEEIKDNIALLSFEFIEKAVSALCAFYSNFQQQHFDYDLQTIED